MEQLVSTGRARNCERLLTYQLPKSAAQVPELREVSGGPTPSAATCPHIEMVVVHYRTVSEFLRIIFAAKPRSAPWM